MDLLLAIVLIVLAFLGGALGGMYLARKQIEKKYADNPRLNADAVRAFLSANGQKPSESQGTTSLPPNYPPTKKQLLLRTKRNK